MSYWRLGGRAKHETKNDVFFFPFEVYISTTSPNFIAVISAKSDSHFPPFWSKSGFCALAHVPITGAARVPLGLRLHVAAGVRYAAYWNMLQAILPLAATPSIAGRASRRNDSGNNRGAKEGQIRTGGPVFWYFGNTCWHLSVRRWW